MQLLVDNRSDSTKMHGATIRFIEYKIIYSVVLIGKTIYQHSLNKHKGMMLPHFIVKIIKAGYLNITLAKQGMYALSTCTIKTGFDRSTNNCFVTCYCPTLTSAHY